MRPYPNSGAQPFHNREIEEPGRKPAIVQSEKQLLCRQSPGDALHRKIGFSLASKGYQNEEPVVKGILDELVHQQAVKSSAVSIRIPEPLPKMQSANSKPSECGTIWAVPNIFLLVEPPGWVVQHHIVPFSSAPFLASYFAIGWLRI